MVLKLNNIKDKIVSSIHEFDKGSSKFVDKSYVHIKFYGFKEWHGIISNEDVKRLNTWIRSSDDEIFQVINDANRVIRLKKEEILEINIENFNYKDPTNQLIMNKHFARISLFKIIFLSIMGSIFLNFMETKDIMLTLNDFHGISLYTFHFFVTFINILGLVIISSYGLYILKLKFLHNFAELEFLKLKRNNKLLSSSKNNLLWYIVFLLVMHIIIFNVKKVF